MWITEELAAAVKKKLVVVAAFHASNFNARDSLESVPDAVRRLDFSKYLQIQNSGKALFHQAENTF